MLAPALLMAGVLAGCDDNNTSTTAPDVPVIVSETFSGTVTVNGAFVHPFVVARAGQVMAQITALAPDDTVKVGMALGIWNGAACQLIIANEAATLSTIVIGTATAPGALCVRVADNGALVAPASYDVKVDHY